MKLGQFFLTLSAAILLNACASMDDGPDIVENKSAPKMSTENMKNEVKKNEEAAATAAAAIPVAPAPEAKPVHKELTKLSGKDPAVAYGWLKNGNARYLKGFVRKDGQSKKDIERLASGQNPHTVVLSCSDSRVPPELVFDQKLGEIFVVRTAGEVLNPAVIGSIEYAVEHLGTRLILVMGHTSCGAVKAAINTINGSSTGSSNIDAIVKDIHPRIEKMLSSHQPAKNVKDESWANSIGVARDLLDRSSLISEFVKDGQVQIKSALYNIETGKVDFE